MESHVRMRHHDGLETAWSVPRRGAARPAVFAVVVLVLVLAGCSQGIYQDGVYHGASDGQYGAVEIAVTVENGRISGVDIVTADETPAMLESVRENLIPTIIDEQGTAGVDAVSGATGTSNAILQAVDQALAGKQRQ